MLTMLERRKTPRETTLKPGSVSFGVAAIVDCTVLNISTAGACLEFGFRPVLPKTFSVVIKPEYMRRAWCGSRNPASAWSSPAGAEGSG
jgi:hypothetical protein